ncbi:TITAN-like protein [Andrographis paniculata]|uniref:TITAN-like protein n=1 Tax=Andrographis paniculata TaxID=175694 RepID=UPI0021E7BA9C|nr:TITAN-like protein [Andrographis paniculata]
MHRDEEKKRRKNSDEQRRFEFCEVCRLNQNQGRRHKFFPSHKSSLSKFLAHFQSKLSDVKFFLKTPMPLRPEHAHQNRLWCVFCNCDIEERDSAFACGNAINHLASGEHWKKLKEFMWKHGGGTDQIDLFRITEADFAKWERKCSLLKKETAKGVSIGPVVGPSKNIHKEPNDENVDSFRNSSVESFNSHIANDVVPLHSYTNEGIQVSTSSVSMAGPSLRDMSAAIQVGNLRGFNSPGVLATNGSSYDYPNNGSALLGERSSNGQSISPGLVHLTQISNRNPTEGNVHTGAPPPWFDATNGNQLDLAGNQEPGNLVSSKARKASNLNMKRVGAAWAEKRRREMELEKKGELVGNNFDANWLPNFGRVWQTGTRKESRKEFRMENKASLQADNQSETPVRLQPYVSKRMRGDTTNLLPDNSSLKDAIDE